MGSHMEEDILEKDFRMLISLGCGSFGEVKLACHLPTHTRVAVRVLEKNTNSVADISTEVNILQSLEHRNIVRFFDMINTLATTYVIMEYVAGEDLESCLRSLGCLKEEEARVIFRQVVSAVHFLHQRHIAHCDIKLENILVDAAGNAKLCDFGMAIEITEGQMLQDICGALLYWAPEILARKPYDGLAGDMWSLGIVLYVLVTGHFPYMEDTLEGMHRLITTTMCPIPYHLSKPCHIIIARLLMVPIWYRFIICQLLERPWLGPIQEHALPATKEILPQVMETMCTMGYTCEEIVSSLTHRREDNHVMATCNILKHQLSCGDSTQQDQMPWLTSSPAGPVHPPLLLMRRASEPAFTTSTQAGKSHFKEEGVEERGEVCRSHTMPHRSSFPDELPCSDNTVPEGDALMADVINTATEDIAVNRNAVDHLPGNLSSPESILDSTPTGFLNLGFSEEDSSQEPDFPSDQPQVAYTTSGSRPFRFWKLVKKRISHALRALCCCCCPPQVWKLKWPNRIPDLVRSDCHRSEPELISRVPAPSNPGQQAPACSHPPAIGSERPLCISFNFIQLPNCCGTKRVIRHMDSMTLYLLPSFGCALGPLTLHGKQQPLPPGVSFIPISAALLLGPFNPPTYSVTTFWKEQQDLYVGVAGERCSTIGQWIPSFSVLTSFIQDSLAVSHLLTQESCINFPSLGGIYN